MGRLCLGTSISVIEILDTIYLVSRHMVMHPFCLHSIHMQQQSGISTQATGDDRFVTTNARPASSQAGTWIPAYSQGVRIWINNRLCILLMQYNLYAAVVKPMSWMDFYALLAACLLRFLLGGLTSVARWAWPLLMPDRVRRALLHRTASMGQASRIE